MSSDEIAVIAAMLPPPEGHVKVQGDGGVWMTIPRDQCSAEFLAEYDERMAQIASEMPSLEK